MLEFRRYIIIVIQRVMLERTTIDSEILRQYQFVLACIKIHMYMYLGIINFKVAI